MGSKFRRGWSPRDRSSEEEVKAWQSRPLEGVYPILYLDALRVKMRDGGTSEQADLRGDGGESGGHKEILGLWTAANEGANSGCRC